jgi:hypothetical protein
LITHFDFEANEYIELDRVRIWDYYLLFPNEMHKIKLKKRDEKDVRLIIEKFIPLKDNPYEVILDNRKMFERIRPYQLSALKSLVSYGILDKEYWKLNRIRITSKERLTKYSEKSQEPGIRDNNLVKLLTSHFYTMSMFGEWGLKNRSNLIETKYDAQ